jgi:hypothetical protein
MLFAPSVSNKHYVQNKNFTQQTSMLIEGSDDASRVSSVYCHARTLEEK